MAAEAYWTDAKPKNKHTTDEHPQKHNDRALDGPSRLRPHDHSSRRFAGSQAIRKLPRRMPSLRHCLRRLRHGLPERDRRQSNGALHQAVP